MKRIEHIQLLADSAATTSLAQKGGVLYFSWVVEMDYIRYEDSIHEAKWTNVSYLNMLLNMPSLATPFFFCRMISYAQSSDTASDTQSDTRNSDTEDLLHSWHFEAWT